MTIHLVKGGYQQSKYDQCLFFKWISPNKFIYIVVHVDDFSLTGIDDEMIEDFIGYLKTGFPEMTNVIELPMQIVLKSMMSWFGLVIYRLGICYSFCFSLAESFMLFGLSQLMINVCKSLLHVCYYEIII
jgi:hypothetical protein